MGNAAAWATPQPGARRLQLCLSQPHLLDVPLGRNKLPCALVAKVRTDGDDAPTAVPWDEAITIDLTDDSAMLLISILAVELGPRETSQATTLAQVCLPYGDASGLRSLGVSPGASAKTLKLNLTPGDLGGDDPAKMLHAMLSSFDEQKPHLEVKVRELCPEVPLEGQEVPKQSTATAHIPTPSASFQMLSAKRQVVTLELQNNAMLKELKLKAGTSFHSPKMSHRMQLQELRDDNARLSGEKQLMWHKLEWKQGIVSQSASGAELGKTKHNSKDKDAALTDWGKTLEVMEQELRNCWDRRRLLQTSYQERISMLQNQIRQAREPPSQQALTEAQAQASITIATGRREELKRKLTEAEQVVEGEESAENSREGADIAEMHMLSEFHRAKLEELRKDLTGVDTVNFADRQQHKELTASKQRLADELEELRQVREDERVRRESEICELRRERDLPKARLEGALSDYGQLQLMAEALQDFHQQPQNVVLQIDLDSLTEANTRTEKELEELGRIESVLRNQIQELERGQEALVEQTDWATAQVVPAGVSVDEFVESLKLRAGQLHIQIEQADAAFDAKTRDLAAMRGMIEVARSRLDNLRQAYVELQSSFDELRVLRNPNPYPVSASV